MKLIDNVSEILREDLKGELNKDTKISNKIVRTAKEYRIR